jgi:uncharacterized tellurite resistance protein B-like protein
MFAPADWPDVFGLFRQIGPMMFGHLKSLILSLAGTGADEKASGQRTDIVRIIALLIRVATVHHEMSSDRLDRLRAIVGMNYEPDEAAAARLIDDALAAARMSVDLYRFTQPLNRALDAAGRRRIVQMMWDVVYADGAVNEFEQNIIWRAADLLGVSTRQRVELRLAIAADMEASAQRVTMTSGR